MLMPPAASPSWLAVSWRIVSLSSDSFLFFIMLGSLPRAKMLQPTCCCTNQAFPDDIPPITPKAVQAARKLLTDRDFNLYFGLFDERMAANHEKVFDILSIARSLTGIMRVEAAK